MVPGSNRLAIRIDNPPHSSRWYPGAKSTAIYLVKDRPVHVGQWGTFVTTPQVSQRSSTIHLDVTVDNDFQSDANIAVSTSIFALDTEGRIVGRAIAMVVLPPP